MQDLQNKTNIGEMFNIQEKENGEIAISGRELHQALEVKTPYKKWFERMSDYGFEENIDYAVTDIFVHNPLGGRQNQTDHALTLDTAKEIAMIQRSEPGKRARQYFIQVEKAWNSPEMIMQRALKIANSTINQLETQIERDKPKVMFADAVDTSTSSILVGELAKLISQNGVKIVQNRLFQWLRDNGYLIKKQGEAYNLPTQRSMDLKIMDIKKRTQNNPDGSIRVTRTTKITGKGQQYFINKFLAGEL
ncbi:phage antirepressor KilAC domain-containing protein [Staphylococcus haemolyticus]|uniref:phage antirepressor KilAC domain-containing protein n=2 Tax=Staphylococcus haemolyticus TaxID=1283 RepID=UPI00069E2F4B|nr:phage antirepressor KilAC domain-containing protein [Staphylococcus haemolyticus]